VAAALDRIGGLVGVESFPTTVRVNEQLPKWMAGFEPVARVGVEGTGFYGAGLARHSCSAGLRWPGWAKTRSGWRRVSASRAPPGPTTSSQRWSPTMMARARDALTVPSVA
jgi:hypothetical protein